MGNKNKYCIEETLQTYTSNIVFLTTLLEDFKLAKYRNNIIQVYYIIYNISPNNT